MRSSLWQSTERLVCALRPLSVVQLTFALPAAAIPNGCLVAVSVSSPSNGHRRQPLRCSRPDSDVGFRLISVGHFWAANGGYFE